MPTPLTPAYVSCLTDTALQALRTALLEQMDNPALQDGGKNVHGETYQSLAMERLLVSNEMTRRANQRNPARDNRA